MCEFEIVDDITFEDSKDFEAVLKEPLFVGGPIKLPVGVGPPSRARVLIKDDDRT